MEIFKQLKKLGYKHYIDLTIEEFDALSINDIEKRIEYSLIIDWLREKYNLCIEIQCPQREFDFYSWTIHEPLGINDEEYNCQTYEDGFTNNYYKAREQAILKAIELCQKEK